MRSEIKKDCRDENHVSGDLFILSSVLQLYGAMEREGERELRGNTKTI